ncbi:MAG: metallophosphoesterase [Pirellulaceae bacterium]|nr:metallophosphoesterase [Pirellulaceae bacterium]
MTRSFLILWCLFVSAPTPGDDAPTATANRISFLVCGDPQYLAEHADKPTKLDPLSEQANSGFVNRVLALPGSELPKSMGGGTVAAHLRGLINTGDLIDSLDKSGGPYPSMQRFEWQRFLADYGLTGQDGRIPLPVYEIHGNHDGPQGDTFVVDAIIERNKKRPGLVNVSSNGLHYSWDWGPLHLINVGIFVGEGEQRREDHHYAPRASLEFLRDDLAKHVGDSGRPVIISHHLHLDAPEYDWPAVDLAAYYDAIRDYNVVAIFSGHTHGSPPKHRRWDGKRIGPHVDGIDNFDPDDAGASKLHKGEPVGVAHGLLYVEIIDRPGTDNDRMLVRSYVTRDNWETAQWDRLWEKPIESPDGASVDASTIR